MPPINKKYDLIFIDGNLDDITANEIKRITNKNSLIVLHDFQPPFDKGLYDLHFLAKYIDFFYFAPNTKFEKLNLSSWIDCNNGQASYDTLDYSSLNKCSCLIYLNKEFLKIFTSGSQSSKSVSSKIIFLKYFFFGLKILRYIFKINKKIYILKLFSKIFILDCIEQKIIKSKIQGNEINFKKVYF